MNKRIFFLLFLICSTQISVEEKINFDNEAYPFTSEAQESLFYSLLNSKDEAIVVEKALNKSKSFIRTMLGKSLHLKKIPNIAFLRDHL